MLANYEMKSQVLYTQRLACFVSALLTILQPSESLATNGLDLAENIDISSSGPDSGIFTLPRHGEYLQQSLGGSEFRQNRISQT
jgi:hypothetical protein